MSLERQSDSTLDLLERFLNEASQRYGFEFGVVDMRNTMRKLKDIPSDSESVLSLRELERLKQFSLPKKKVQWISGRYAVKNALSQWMKVRVQSPDLRCIDLVNGKNSAPYLVQYPEIYVSITHSFPYCIGVVSERRIGIDLEKVTTLRPSLLEMFYHPEELQHLSAHVGFEEHDRLAINYWTRKEAVSKLFGLGMAIGFKELNTVEDMLVFEKHGTGKILLSSFGVDNFNCSFALEDESV